MTSEDPATRPERAVDDIEDEDEEKPAFEIDLDPEDQGTAGAGSANPD